MDLRSKLKLPVVVTYLLFCIFGIGSWIAINGVWAEISLLVLTLPECAKLPAILVVVIQIANIGPLAYTAVRYLFRRLGWSQRYLEITTVFVLVAVGAASCILLAIFWSDTASVLGSSHSVALIVLSFTLALVDCTSSVVFIPFMKHFPAMYISALYIGEGMSGLLPNIVALSQGFVNNSLTCIESYPSVSTLGINFSPSVYFIFLASMMLLCGAAFLAIITVPMVTKQMVTHQPLSDDPLSQSDCSSDTPLEEEDKTCSNLSEIDEDDEEGTNFPSDSASGEASYKSPLMDTPQETETKLRRGRLCFSDNQSHACPQARRCPNDLRILWSNLTILSCLGILGFLAYGSVSAISAYAFLPYGNTTYHLAINLGALANPAAIIVYMVLSHKSKRVTVALSGVACLLGVYMLVAALLAPDPPLKDTIGGNILIVSSLHAGTHNHIVKMSRYYNTTLCHYWGMSVK